MCDKKLAKAALKLGVDVEYVKNFVKAIKDYGTDSDQYKTARHLVEQKLKDKEIDYRATIRECGIDI